MATEGFSGGSPRGPVAPRQHWRNTTASTWGCCDVWFHGGWSHGGTALGHVRLGCSTKISLDLGTQSPPGHRG
eukprot:152865-Pyramimonas_sp.AAC.1